MTIVEFAGSIHTDDPEIVEWILRAWAPRGELRAKVRLSGEGFDSDTDTFALYVRNAQSLEGPYYPLNGEAQADMADVRADLVWLWTLCRNGQIEANFEYIEVDEDRRVLGEELNVP